jgi:hypothetical protein
MKQRDIADYLENSRATLLAAGVRAFDELGPGAFVVYPQRNQGNGTTPVKYHPVAWFVEDEDPAAGVVASSQQPEEIIIVCAMDRPPGIYTYRLTATGAALVLPASDIV